MFHMRFYVPLKFSFKVGSRTGAVRQARLAAAAPHAGGSNIQTQIATNDMVLIKITCKRILSVRSPPRFEKPTSLIPYPVLYVGSETHETHPSCRHTGSIIHVQKFLSPYQDGAKRTPFGITESTGYELTPATSTTGPKCGGTSASTWQSLVQKQDLPPASAGNFPTLCLSNALFFLLAVSRSVYRAR